MNSVLKAIRWYINKTDINGLGYVDYYMYRVF